MHRWLSKAPSTSKQRRPNLVHLGGAERKWYSTGRSPLMPTAGPVAPSICRTPLSIEFRQCLISKKHHAIARRKQPCKFSQNTHPDSPHKPNHNRLARCITHISTCCTRPMFPYRAQSCHTHSTTPYEINGLQHCRLAVVPVSRTAPSFAAGNKC